MVFQEKEDKSDLGYSNLINISIDHEIRARKFYIIIRSKSSFDKNFLQNYYHKIFKRTAYKLICYSKTIVFFFEGI